MRWLLALIVLAGLLGCGGQSHPLVGSWTAAEGGTVFVFRDDGAGQLRRDGQIERFSWRVEEDLILLLFPDAARGEQLAYAIGSDGTLALTPAGESEPRRFQRE